ncbi:DUF6538 domain-containing protein [uncultured Brevundimonas sp.]|uniref:DUF6538 domain-containing protein n=1 Tax=uncultured Brevundimonas sp. TaxID=213418 RepID=UPI002612457C|nr:DUF6538 domain-containing protein [uncultured Brevundimonas sp.]
MLTYLTKRGSTYYFRRVVPHDLRERVGKSEFTFSLKTKDKAEAKRRCLEAAQQVQAAIDEASEANPLEPVSTTTLAAKPMSRAVTKALAYRAVQNRRRAAFQAGSLAEEDEHWRNQIDIYRAAMRGELDLGMTLDKLEGSIAGVEAALSGADDDALLARADQYLAERAKPPEPMGQMLDDILPIWALDRNPTPKTQQMFKATCVAFEEVAGRKTVGAYAPADIRAYVTKLREKGRSAATIESRLNHLRALFRQGIGQGWITTDPTASIKPPTKGDAKQVRRPFTVDELAAIFSSPVFKDSQRPKGGGGEAAFWLPLLALWTGARLNEIGHDVTPVSHPAITRVRG